MDKIRIIQIHAAIAGASTALAFTAATSGTSPKRAVLTHAAVLVTTTVITRRLLRSA